MDFQKSTVIHVDINDFFSSIINASVDIHIDIQVGISMQGYSTKAIRERQISLNGYAYFY